MASSTPWWQQRLLWTIAMALASLAFWIVGLGAGLRAWILSANSGGIVAHAQSFGEDAYIWWVPATILMMTAVLMAIGTTVVRHLAGGPVEVQPKLEPKPEKKPLPPKKPLEPKAFTGAGDTDGPTASPAGDPGKSNPPKP